MKDNVAFHIPIALDKDTHDPKNINDVLTELKGLDCNCYCPICNEDLIAAKGEVNKHHFKHQSNSNCTIKGETYIHWLSKIIFEREKQIFLPPIYCVDMELGEKKTQFYDLVNTIVEKYEKVNNVTIREFFKTSSSIKSNYSLLNQILVKEGELITFNEVNSEKGNDSNLGKFISDIIGYNENQVIAIEPFVTNPINENKLKKLVDNNLTTISIDLNSFYSKYNWDFKYDDLKEFLIHNISSKKWVNMDIDLKNKNLESLSILIKNSLTLFLDSNIQKLNDYNNSHAKRRALIAERIKIDKAIIDNTKEIEEQHKLLLKSSGSISKILDLKTDSYFDYNLE